MDYRRIAQDFLEVLRGKTKIHNIEIYHKGQLEDVITSDDVTITSSESKTNININDSFLSYVRAQYINDFLRVTENMPITQIQLCISQVFESGDNRFYIQINAGNVLFTNRRYIEDTLFFDLTRYLEQKNIPYEVH